MSKLTFIKIAYVSAAVLCTGFAFAPQGAAAADSYDPLLTTTPPPEQHQTLTIDTDTAKTLVKEYDTWTIAETPLFALPESLELPQSPVFRTSYEPSLTYAYAREQLQTLKREVEEARLVIGEANGLQKVTEFSPGTPGVTPDFRASTIRILKQKNLDSTTVDVAAFYTYPKTTLADTNTLGIDTLLAEGQSDFSHSSKNRIANITAGMKKVRGALVAPGETYSFNKYLGEVTAEDGFKPEIVIKATGLTPELGGGICQVSSTLFRAVMKTGMPIATRKNHAFSVSHYFPPGTDATVYSPYTDFKFVNDTGHTVFIWSEFKDDHTLLFRLYGTPDNRTVVLEKPIQWDRKSDGSMKASWTRRVTINGETRTDVIKSNYLPPAIFKKEETYVAQTPPPAETTPKTPSNTPTPETTPGAPADTLKPTT